jgi:hypothetical protein
MEGRNSIRRIEVGRLILSVGEFGPDRWTQVDPAWAAPEFDLGGGRRLVLDSPDPFPEEEWVVVGVN